MQHADTQHVFSIIYDRRNSTTEHARQRTAADCAKDRMPRTKRVGDYTLGLRGPNWGLSFPPPSVLFFAFQERMYPPRLL